MVWLPTVKLAVLKLAVVVPPAVVSVPWPRLVAPSEKVTTPVGVLLAGGAWQPTLPLPFLDGLLSLAQGTVQFRFTPLGAGSGWQIDDIYVDPFKSR